MGFFDAFGKKKGIVLGAPVDGECVPITEVSDPTFGDEILGKGVAIRPTNGVVCAPADGVVSTAFPTGHAVAVTTSDGVEVLIHVGLDTVQLNGKYFELKVAADQEIKKGDVLIVADIQKIQEEGYDIITPVVICNSSDFTDIEGITGNVVKTGDEVLRIKK